MAKGLGPDFRVLLDARPLQGADSQRGIGSYVRGLITGLRSERFDASTALLFDAGLPIPPVPAGDFVAYKVRSRYPGRLGLVEEAATLGGRLKLINHAIYHATTLALPGRSPTPIVATVHDLIPWALGGWRMLGERSRWWLGRRLLRRCDLVIAPSNATARDAQLLAGVAAGRLLVIPEGVAPGFAPAPGARERVTRRHGLQKPYLLFVGALDVRKDPASLLRAWQVSRAAGADTELVLVGAAGPQTPGGMDSAWRLGYLDHSALVDVYSAATCLLFPSRYEGFGLPVLEAMACGCPVVAYDNSSLPEVGGDAAMLVTDGDAEALGRAASDIALSMDLASRLRAKGLAWSAKFSWSSAARATVGAYERLLHHARRR